MFSLLNYLMITIKSVCPVHIVNDTARKLSKFLSICFFFFFFSNCLIGEKIDFFFLSLFIFIISRYVVFISLSFLCFVCFFLHETPFNLYDWCLFAISHTNIFLFIHRFTMKNFFCFFCLLFFRNFFSRLTYKLQLVYVLHLERNKKKKNGSLNVEEETVPWIFYFFHLFNTQQKTKHFWIPEMERNFS